MTGPQKRFAGGRSLVLSRARWVLLDGTEDTSGSGTRAPSKNSRSGDSSVQGPADLSVALNGRSVGDRVAVTWTDASGAGRTGTVTLAPSPTA